MTLVAQHFCTAQTIALFIDLLHNTAKLVRVPPLASFYIPCGYVPGGRAACSLNIAMQCKHLLFGNLR